MPGLRFRTFIQGNTVYTFKGVMFTFLQVQLIDGKAFNGLSIIFYALVNKKKIIKYTILMLQSYCTIDHCAY